MTLEDDALFKGQNMKLLIKFVFISKTNASHTVNCMLNVKEQVSRNKMTFDELISKYYGKTSYKIGSDWLRWGRHLGLSDSDLDNIGSDGIKCYEKADMVLKKWKQKNGNPSWEQLKKELMAFERYDIVVEIENEFEDDFSSQEKMSYETMDFDLSEQASKKIKNNISEVCTALKKYYQKNYGKINEVQPLLKVHANVYLIEKFVDLCIVDAYNAQIDVVCSDERKKFLEKQMSYKPIPYSDIFMKENSAILISGIAGIGKTWLLRKCLLDWSNDLIWNNVELVFYLECRKINQYQNISSINELLHVLYKDILNDFSIRKHNALFIIDGIDEFRYLNELLNPSLSCTYSIVSALAEIQNYKHVVAGRVYAIDKYQKIYTEDSDKLTIQIMGFNKNGIKNYVKKHVIEEKKEDIKATLKESPIAKVMASVPFYLSLMCKIISDSSKIYTTSFLTMTELYANTFLYFLQKHIIKNNGLVYEMMGNESNKKYVLNICRIAFELFIENKFIFSKEEVSQFINDFNEVDESLFGFIERIETHRGYCYQFAHLTVMEFCASIYAYNCLSSVEIMANKKLESCLPMICGLTYKSQNCLLQFLVNLNPSKNSKEDSSLLFSIFDRLKSKIKSSEIKFRKDYDNLFIECFYESQSSFIDEIISFVDERRYIWGISIYDGKTSYLTSCENYFVNHYLKSGRKLPWLRVIKNILSDEEKKLLIQCLTNVRDVTFNPINFEGWKPKDKIENKIERLSICISRHLITKKDFEENFLPWFNLCEELDLTLHDDNDFIKEICKWIRCSNVKKFEISYRGKYFRNLNKLKYFTTR